MEAAATTIAVAWRQYLCDVRIAKMQDILLKDTLRRGAEEQAERRRLKELELQRFTLEGASTFVWPIMRETIAVMGCSVIVVNFAPAAFRGLPGPFDVNVDDPAEQQMAAALSGAAVMVAGFCAIFMALILLYTFRCDAILHFAHALYLCGVFAAPFCLLVVRLFEHSFGAPLDALTLAFLTANATVPAIALIQWPATSARFANGRRLYAAALAILCAWLLAYVPYSTAISALLLLALLDVLLVSLPGAPVQRLDQAHSERVRAGEPQMPGMTFKHSGLELGLGDFIIYSAFAAHASRAGVAPLAAVTIGILVGLALTMMHIALARRRTVVPALPLSVALGALMLAAERFVMQPFVASMASRKIFT